MKQNFNGFSIRSHDNEFTDATIESLGCFVGSLLGLLVVCLFTFLRFLFSRARKPIDYATITNDFGDDDGT